MRSTPKLRQPRTRFAPAKPRFRRGFKRKGGTNLCSSKPISPAADGQRPGRRSKHISPIGKHWLSKPLVVKRGDREICNPLTDEGRAEYKWRTILMWIRQDGWCCFHEYDFCPGRLKLKDSTFEHEGKRTKGQQDDRISYFDAAGKEQPMNGAAHGECNGIAGSRKLPIWHGTNTIYEKEKAA
jgi:hypothetical protein